MLEVYELLFPQYDVESNQESIPSALVSYKVDNKVIRPLSELVLMQSTGRVDRNGKEIFEGDIVSRKYPNGCFKSGDIWWNESAARFYVNSDYGLEWDICCSGELMVVGNIYENPELLKEAGK
jgi:hypothetical protein